MSQKSLPNEVVLLIMHYTLRPSKKERRSPLFQQLNMRRVCKAVNTDVLRYYFDEADVLDLDGGGVTPTGKPCKQCQGAVRPERAKSVMHKNTVLRYIVGLVAHKELPKYDMRLRIRKELREAAKQLKRDFIDGGGRPEITVPPNLDLEGSFLEVRGLCLAIIALLGVQNAWAFLGPHHASCSPAPLERILKDKPPIFWKLITAVYVGDEEEKLVMSYIGALEGMEETLRLESLSAALTVAIRGGHQGLVNALLSPIKPGANFVVVESSQGQVTLASREKEGEEPKVDVSEALSDPVLNGTAYFRGLTVIDTAFVSTTDPNPVVARVATDVLRCLLPHWQARGGWGDMQIRAVTEVSAKSGLCYNASRQFSRPRAMHVNERRFYICFHKLPCTTISTRLS